MTDVLTSAKTCKQSKYSASLQSLFRSKRILGVTPLYFHTELHFKITLIVNPILQFKDFGPFGFPVQMEREKCGKIVHQTTRKLFYPTNVVWLTERVVVFTIYMLELLHGTAQYHAHCILSTRTVILRYHASNLGQPSAELQPAENYNNAFIPWIDWQSLCTYQR